MYAASALLCYQLTVSTVTGPFHVQYGTHTPLVAPQATVSGVSFDLPRWVGGVMWGHLQLVALGLRRVPAAIMVFIPQNVTKITD